jgi:nitric oxide reductase large subunit
MGRFILLVMSSPVPYWKRKRPEKDRSERKMKSILSARLNNQQGITELYFADARVGWVQRIENGEYKAHSYVSGKNYQGQKIIDVCLPIEKELDRR